MDPYTTQYKATPQVATNSVYGGAPVTPPQPPVKVETGAEIMAKNQNQGKAGYDVFGNPVSATPTQPITPASVYGQMNDYMSKLTANQPATAPVDEGAVRAEVMKRIQAEIDAQNAVFDTKIAEANRAGAGRIGQTNAINARRGLMGSDFGAANVDTTTRANTAITDKIQAERQATISSLYSQGDALAASRIADARKASTDNIDNYLKYLATKNSYQQTVASEIAKNAVAASFSLMDEVNLNDVAQKYGIAPEALQSAYVDALNADELRKVELETKKNANDKTTKDKRYITLSDGATLYDTETGKVVSENVKNYAPQSSSIYPSIATTGGDSVSGKFVSDIDALAGTVSVSLPKHQREALYVNLNKARNPEESLTIIASAANVPAAIKTDVINASTAIPNIDKALALIENGVQTGRLEQGKQYLSNIMGADSDPEIAQINQIITATIQPYRNAITGAAWGVQETGEYNAMFGNIGYEPAALKLRLQGMKDILRRSVASKIQSSINPMSFGSGAFTQSLDEVNPSAESAGGQYVSESGNTYQLPY
jgi:hypothetical protein